MLPSNYSIDKLVYITLGYSLRDLDGTNLTRLTMSPIDPSSEVYVRSMIESLAEIDIKITDAISDSMAEVVDKLKLNYAQHISYLRDLGSTQLKELARFVDIPVKYDKYLGTMGTSSRPIAIRNYY